MAADGQEEAVGGRDRGARNEHELDEPIEELLPRTLLSHLAPRKQRPEPPLHFGGALLPLLAHRLVQHAPNPGVHSVAPDLLLRRRKQWVEFATRKHGSWKSKTTIFRVKVAVRACAVAPKRENGTKVETLSKVH